VSRGATARDINSGNLKLIRNKVLAELLDDDTQLVATLASNARLLNHLRKFTVEPASRNKFRYAITNEKAGIFASPSFMRAPKGLGL
jgi:sporulation-control protein spo0M